MKNDHLYPAPYRLEGVIIGYECISAIDQPGCQLNCIRYFQFVDGSQPGGLHGNLFIHIGQKQIVGVGQDISVSNDQVVILFFQGFYQNFNECNLGGEGAKIPPAYFLKQRFNDVDVGGIFFNELDEWRCVHGNGFGIFQQAQ